jgi:hypothetical protein
MPGQQATLQESRGEGDEHNQAQIKNGEPQCRSKTRQYRMGMRKFKFHDDCCVWWRRNDRQLFLALERIIFDMFITDCSMSKKWAQRTRPREESKKLCDSL